MKWFSYWKCYLKINENWPSREDPFFKYHMKRSCDFLFNRIDLNFNLDKQISATTLIIASALPISFAYIFAPTPPFWPLFDTFGCTLLSITFSSIVWICFNTSFLCAWSSFLSRHHYSCYYSDWNITFVLYLKQKINILVKYMFWEFSLHIYKKWYSKHIIS